MDPRASCALFPLEVPVLFCFHGYEGQLLRIIARRPASTRFDVHGFRDRGATTTPFGMLYENEMDRFALAAAGFALVDAERFAGAAQQALDARDAMMAYTLEHGIDHPDLGLM